MVLSQLISTNDPPSSNELMYIREQIDAIEREVGSVDRELQLLERKVASLRSHRSELQNRLDEYRTVLSPCRRIPVEILGEIFAYLAPGECGNRAGTVANLCRVCKTWRYAALLLSSIWHEVAVVLHPDVPFSHESIALWLSRSGTLPKALYLHGLAGRMVPGRPPRYRDQTRQCRDGGDCAFGAPGITTLLKTGPILDTLSINTDRPHCFETFAKSIKASSEEEWSSLKSLRVLCISAVNWAGCWENLSPATFLFIPSTTVSLELHLPSTRALGDNRVDAYSLEINVPPAVLGRLTSLQLRCDWTIDFVFKLLQHCTEVRTVNIDFDNGEDNWIDRDFMLLVHESGISLPKAEVVTLHRVTVPVLDDLRHLQLPSLLKLSISFGDEEWVSTEGVDLIGGDSAWNLITLMVGDDPQRQPTVLSLAIAYCDFRAYDTPLFDVLQVISIHLPN